MKTKAIVATLLIAAAASADARFAWVYPRKTVSPDESGHWIVINSKGVVTRCGVRAGTAKNRRQVRENAARRGTASLGAAPKNRVIDFTLCEMSFFECLR
jgi:hypothetical protein